MIPQVDVVALLLEMFPLSKHLITLEILLLDLHTAYFLSL